MDTFCSEEIGKLVQALLKVQRQLQSALKDADNPFTKSRYATLNSVMDSYRQALLDNGVWLYQYPVPVESGCLGLVTKLTHAESGQWQASLAVVSLPRADPQGVGISMTYIRRYALSAMLGIVTEEDTDGEFPKNRQNGAIRTKRAVNAPQIKKDASDIKPHGQDFRGLKSNVRGTWKIAETGRRFLQNCRGSGRKGMHPCHRQYDGTKKRTVGCRFPLERTAQDMVEVCRRLMNQPTYSIKKEDCRYRRSSSFFRHGRNKECGTETKSSSGLWDR